jgi:4-alpha-glucanotransferase
MLIGENLGTVPAKVNRAMERHGLRTMFMVQCEQREDARRALLAFLRRKKLLSRRADARSVLAARLKYLARSDAEVVLVNLEDLWIETEPQNTPGTTGERANWRRKMRLTLEECFECGM